MPACMLLPIVHACTSSACGPRGAAIIIVSPPDTGAASVTTAPWLLALAAVGCLCWCPRCPLVLLLTTASTVRDGEPWNSAGTMRWRPVRPVVGLGSTCTVTGPGAHEVWVRHPNNREGPLAAGRARTGSIGRNNGDSEGTSGAKAEAAAPASAAVGVLPQGPDRRTRQVRSPKRSAMAKSRPRLACARFCSALGPKMAGDRGLWV